MLYIVKYSLCCFKQLALAGIIDKPLSDREHLIKQRNISSFTTRDAQKNNFSYTSLFSFFGPPCTLQLPLHSYGLLVFIVLVLQEISDPVFTI